MNLRLDSLKKVYTAPDGTTVPVVDIPLLELPAGAQVALVGSSGSGKTTLLHLIAGILTPDSGRILYDFSPPDKSTSPSLSYQAAASSVDLATLSEAQRDVFRGANIGYIFQTHHLLSGFTALENVLLGMSFTGRPHDPKWATYLLEQVGLAKRLDYKPEKLSVGQQQRVAVARALANRPKLVLADEPTGSLDAINAQQVLQLIQKLCAEVGASLLLVSHDKEITDKFQTVMELSGLNQSHRN